MSTPYEPYAIYIYICARPCTSYQPLPQAQTSSRELNWAKKPKKKTWKPFSRQLQVAPWSAVRGPSEQEAIQRALKLQRHRPQLERRSSHCSFGMNPEPQPTKRMLGPSSLIDRLKEEAGIPAGHQHRRPQCQSKVTGLGAQGLGCTARCFAAVEEVGKEVRQGHHEAQEGCDDGTQREGQNATRHQGITWFGLRIK